MLVTSKIFTRSLVELYGVMSISLQGVFKVGQFIPKKQWCRIFLFNSPSTHAYAGDFVMISFGCLQCWRQICANDMKKVFAFFFRQEQLDCIQKNTVNHHNLSAMERIFLQNCPKNRDSWEGCEFIGQSWTIPNTKKTEIEHSA